MSLPDHISPSPKYELIDLNSLFGYWIHFNSDGNIIALSKELQSSDMNLLIHPQLNRHFEIIQPDLVEFQFDPIFLDQIFVLVPRVRQSIRMRMTLHLVSETKKEFILGGWPAPFDLEAAKYWGVQKLMRRPQCQQTDLLILKDINTRLQQKYDEALEQIHQLQKAQK